MRILLCEDEKELSNALTAILKHNHYSVDAVYDGADALAYGVAENYDRILGLDAGADDYLTKPFATGELLARVRAMTRRKFEFAPNMLKCGNIRLNREPFELSSNSSTDSFRLGSKEFQMLELLMTNSGRVISTEQFMERVWGYDTEAGINGVWVYISYLRKKLSALEATVEIKALRGIGYTIA